MNIGKEKELKVSGVTIHGFAKACINLDIVIGSKAKSLISEIDINVWYPFESLRNLERLVIDYYENADPIM